MRTTTTRRRSARSKLRRRVAGALALGIALLSAGALYSVFVPRPQTAVAADNSQLVAQGQQVFDNHCISCHGQNLQGVTDRGPSLIGVGSAATYFQVSSGRMPLAIAGGAGRSASTRSRTWTRTPRRVGRTSTRWTRSCRPTAVGRSAPRTPGRHCAVTNPARGGELFRLNCASCHNFTGQGGRAVLGKFAPELTPATEDQDLHRDAQRPAEHAATSPTASCRRRRRRTSSRTSRRSLRVRTTPAGTGSAISARCPKA